MAKLEIEIEDMHAKMKEEQEEYLKIKAKSQE